MSLPDDEHTGHSGQKRVANDPGQVAALVQLFQDYACQELIANLETQLKSVEIAGNAFPLTVNDGTPTCYICSPAAAYIDYALDETRNFGGFPRLQKAICRLISGLAPLVRASGLDRQVQLNNWLFSTNPVPDLDRDTVRQIRSELTQVYPTHAIVLRSLNELADEASLVALRQEGFRILPARQIYLVADADKAAGLKNMRADTNRLKRTHFQYAGNGDFLEEDYPRCARLYEMLYLVKYTPLNPQYTATYIRRMHEAGLLRLAGLRDSTGKLVAVSGTFLNGRTLTQPIVGYDTSLPKTEGLYRMVMAMAQAEARRTGAFFNVSAGAADFKRRRGAVPVIEFTAVYIRHLPLRMRLATAIMEIALRTIGIPLLRKFEL
ncbi:GNAT family N-acetyltransferase [Breoghania sp.]|uniref:GNAT family N-acetyltransferase n=1 Tax=Breoghania sp. TaxID=2065378 RepID=UPI002AAAD6E9|nr:GNAT family N-acetyltransferase [Breoghania sp.]